MTVSETPEAVDPRILFAAERTLFAYVRTGLALMGFGFVAARFGIFLRQLSAVADARSLPSRETTPSELTGILLILCGVALCVYSPIWYGKTVSRLQRGGTYEPPLFGMVSAVAVLVATAGVFMAGYLYLLH